MSLVEEMTEETRNFLGIFNQSPVEEKPRVAEPETYLLKLASVPEVLRDDKSIKECFEPKFVSIGPYHHGKSKLQEAEDLKKKLARQFVLACSCSAETLFGKLYKEIKQIRNFYENKLTVKYNDEALTRILFVDGCFLLYFIYRLSQGPSKDFNLEKNYIESVQWDLCLLENQLPFLVLKLLGENNFEKWPGLFVGFIEFICNSFLPVKGKWKRYNLQPGNSSHLVQLLQIGLQGSYEIKRDVKYLLSPPPNYSVTELKKVGIRCKPSRRGGFKCTRFSPHLFHGVLELPAMAIGLFTRTNLLNLIAYEMNPDVRRLEIQSYIFFLASLVRQPEDVGALREARVLYNYIGSDEEVVELFKEISAKSSPEKMHGYGGIQMQIGRYIDKKGRIKIATWLAQMFSDYCSSPWTAIPVLVVFLSISAAIIQLVLKIVSYKNKKVE